MSDRPPHPAMTSSATVITAVRTRTELCRFHLIIYAAFLLSPADGQSIGNGSKSLIDADSLVGPIRRVTRGTPGVLNRVRSRRGGSVVGVDVVGDKLDRGVGHSEMRSARMRAAETRLAGTEAVTRRFGKICIAIR